MYQYNHPLLGGFGNSQQPAPPTVSGGFGSDPVALVRSRLSGRVARSGRWLSARCPAHEDRNASLSITAQPKRRVFLHCFAGCAEDSVIAALGLRLDDLWTSHREEWKPSTPRPALTRPRQTPKPPTEEAPASLTVEQLAEYCRLPVEFLHSLGVSTSTQGRVPRVVIPYRTAEGQHYRDQTRLRLSGDRFRWDHRTWRPLIPYGLDRLGDAAEVLVVEGASDCWALWQAGFTALGVPGASTWSDTVSRALAGRSVVVVQEPNTEQLVRAAVDALGTDRVRVLTSEQIGAKDPLALWRALDADPEAFRARMLEAVASAEKPKGLLASGTPSRDYPYSSGEGEPALAHRIREKLRKAAGCRQPVGRVDRIGGTRTQFLIVDCERRSCPQCRAKAEAIDAARVSVSLHGRPVWVGYAEEADWHNAQRRLEYAGATYWQTPAPGDRRAVLSTEAVSGVAWVPVVDLVGELERITAARPLDRRRSGGTQGEGGVMTSEKLEDYLRGKPKPPKEKLEPLGVFPVRAFYASRAEYLAATPAEQVDRLRLVASSHGLDVVPVAGGFETTARPTEQRLAEFLRAVAFTPFEGADLFGVANRAREIFEAEEVA